MVMNCSQYLSLKVAEVVANSSCVTTKVITYGNFDLKLKKYGLIGQYLLHVTSI